MNVECEIPVIVEALHHLSSNADYRSFAASLEEHLTARHFRVPLIFFRLLVYVCVCACVCMCSSVHCAHWMLRAGVSQRLGRQRWLAADVADCDRVAANRYSCCSSGCCGRLPCVYRNVMQKWKISLLATLHRTYECFLLNWWVGVAYISLPSDAWLLMITLVFGVI